MGVLQLVRLLRQQLDQLLKLLQLVRHELDKLLNLLQLCGRASTRCWSC